MILNTVVQKVPFFEQVFFRFYVVFIGQATVYGTYGCALRFFIKPDTFCTLIAHDEKYIVFFRCLCGIGIHREAWLGSNFAFERCAVGKSPFHSSFVDCVIRALGLARSTIDAFVGNFYCHFANFSLILPTRSYKFKFLIHHLDNGAIHKSIWQVGDFSKVFLWRWLMLPGLENYVKLFRGLVRNLYRSNPWFTLMQ